MMRTLLLSMAIGLMLANAATAFDGGGVPGACVETKGAPTCCASCGCNSPCEKSCQVVCEMKEVKKTVWVVHCEEFAPLLPQCKHCCEEEGCTACTAEKPQPVCQTCQGCNGKNCGPCAALENREYVTPKCGKIRDKKTLEKKEITCKVPVYKSVVTYSCSGCSGGEKAPQQQSAPAAKPAPAPAPAPEAPLPKTTQAAPLPPVVGTAYVTR